VWLSYLSRQILVEGGKQRKNRSLSENFSKLLIILRKNLLHPWGVGYQPKTRVCLTRKTFLPFGQFFSENRLCVFSCNTKSQTFHVFSEFYFSLIAQFSPCPMRVIKKSYSILQKTLLAWVKFKTNVLNISFFTDLQICVQMYLLLSGANTKSQPKCDI